MQPTLNIKLDTLAVALAVALVAAAREDAQEEEPAARGAAAVARATATTPRGAVVVAVPNTCPLAGGHHNRILSRVWR